MTAPRPSGAGDLASRIHAGLASRSAEPCLTFVDAEGTRGLTGAELLELATGFTARCDAEGTAPGDVIAIAWGHGPRAIAAWVGSLLGGFVPTFVPHDDAAIAQRLATAVRLTTGPGAIEDWSRAPMRSPRVAPGVAILQRTSGTTGVHRSVALDAGRVLAQIDGLAAALELEHRDRIASALPLHHDMGLVSTVLLPLACGVPCVHVDPALWRADAGALLREIDRSRATLTWTPPAALSWMASRVGATRLDLSSLRQIVTGGDVVSPEAIDRFASHFAASGLGADVLGSGWGMAENVAAVTHSPPGRAPLRMRVAWSSFGPGARVVATLADDALTLVSSGHAIAGTQVEVRDATGHRSSDGVPGELFVRGTCQAVPDVWSATGDLGVVVDTEVFVCGRIADLLHVDGRWIPPQEAERAAATIAGVRPGRVAAIPDEGGGFAVLVETAVSIATRPIADAVLAHTRRRPRVVLVAPDTLPRSTSGKLARGRCAALLGAR